MEFKKLTKYFGIHTDRVRQAIKDRYQLNKIRYKYGDPEILRSTDKVLNLKQLKRLKKSLDRPDFEFKSESTSNPRINKYFKTPKIDDMDVLTEEQINDKLRNNISNVIKTQKNDHRDEVVDKELSQKILKNGLKNKNIKILTPDSKFNPYDMDEFRVMHRGRTSILLPKEMDGGKSIIYLENKHRYNPGNIAHEIGHYDQRLDPMFKKRQKHDLDPTDIRSYTPNNVLNYVNGDLNYESDANYRAMRYGYLNGANENQLNNIHKTTDKSNWGYRNGLLATDYIPNNLNWNMSKDAYDNMQKNKNK